MPTFETPDPILVSLELGVGDVRITASDRRDTVVEVRPTDPAKKTDVAAAEQTRVEFADGRLLIKAPKGWRRYSPRGGGESIDVEIDLPSGSQIRGDAGIAALQCSGPLGECHYNTGVGNIQVDQAGPAHFNTGVGDIALARASGHAQINTGSGTVRIGSVDGTAVIKGANGDTWIGDVSRDLRVIAANGSISVDHSHATVVAKDRQRRCAPRRGGRGNRRRSDVARQGGHRDSRRCRSLAGPQHEIRQGVQRARRRRPARRPATRPSKFAPAAHSATSPSTARSRARPRRVLCERRDHAAGGPGHRAAQVIRRQGRPRRHRPRHRRGDGLRAARPQRCRQDDHCADPLDAHPRRRRRHSRRRL